VAAGAIDEVRRRSRCHVRGFHSTSRRGDVGEEPLRQGRWGELCFVQAPHTAVGLSRHQTGSASKLTWSRRTFHDAATTNNTVLSRISNIPTQGEDLCDGDSHARLHEAQVPLAESGGVSGGDSAGELSGRFFVCQCERPFSWTTCYRFSCPPAACGFRSSASGRSCPLAEIEIAAAFRC
jgi:hypothetical protein